MKKGLLVLILMFSLLACDDNDYDSKKSESTKVTEIQNAAVNGQWRITHFFDTDTNETSNFSGYIFEFDSNNTITATNGSNNYPGTWSVANDDDDSNNLKDIDFNIAFTNPPNFEELSEDWEIISHSTTKIEMRHVSGGNGGTDLLTFERI